MIRYVYIDGGDFNVFITRNNSFVSGSKKSLYYNEVSRPCRENNEAVIITVNGRNDTVTPGYEECKRRKAGIEIFETLAEADENVKCGRAAPMKTAFDDLRRNLKEG
jgi:hypothetical protein